ncbi:hypothetical protein F7642_02320 [Tenacibaculum finnmarkense genomovar ulcerans]|uniref:nucleotidyltransferase domain-containing protein n=1 Tax=Tenacibaculum finnmarkense TaxID=2781243 RepID=UPI00187B916D|nr:nucleotidyltransferase domain-containing protein [Tenacibaculum finnmarkense]MBE7633164.1 hypothetical protein [Tenacibaculum finnmarkense genomovar ulcerans]MCD8429078.1 nucleotidyltransferase domain-containing protein [Tenacibaculum finnmarkense genomovar ulcerans]
MKLDKLIIEKIKNFVSSYYNYQYASMVTGSFVDGNNNEYSDIDVLIFTKDKRKVFSETLSYEELKIQAIVLPVQSIQEIFWVDYITGKGAYINMISKGLFLSGNSIFIRNLVSHAKKTKSLGVQPISDVEMYKSRVKISSLLDDIMGGKEISDLYLSIFGLIDEMTNLKLKCSGSWCGEGKHRMRQVRALDFSYYNKLILAIDSLYKNKNKKKIIELAKNQLDSYGGYLPYHSELGTTYSKVSSNSLVVEMKVKESCDDIELLNSVEEIKKFLDNLKFNNLSFYFYKSSPVGQNKLKQEIYIVIIADKDFLNDYLIDRLKMLVKNKNKIVFNFPFKLDHEYRFTNNNLYAQVLPTFIKVSRFLIDNKNEFNKEFQLKFSLIFLKKIKENIFENNSASFIAFIDYLFNCWFVNSYDDGLSQRSNELFDKRNNVLNSFNSLYQEQKKHLNYIYNESNIDDINLLEEEVKLLGKIRNVDSIPLYKAYLLGTEFNIKNRKKMSFYKEYVFRVLSTVLIDNYFISYVPFIISKIERNE